MINNDKQIKYGALLSYASIALNIVAALAYTPWMIGKIGQGQYGLYTLANSLITLFLVDFGLSSATARYVSEYHARGEEERTYNFLGIVYKLYILIDAVICAALIIVYFLIDSIYVKLTPEELSQFKVVYIIAALFSVINFPFVTLNGVLTAYEKFVQLKLADVIYRVLFITTMIGVLQAGFGLYALVTVHALVGLLVVAYKLIVIRKDIPVKVNFHYSNRQLYKDIFGFSFWSTVVSLSQRLIFNITPSILGLFCDSAAIGVFGVVMTVEANVYTLSSAINGMFMPRISQIYTEEHSEKKINQLMVSVGSYQYMLNGLLVVGFAVIGQEFIRLWMGSAYSQAYWGILLVIIPGMFYNALQIANTAIVVKKLVKYNAYISVGMGLLNVILSVFLSKSYSVVGACFSIFVAYMVRIVALLILYNKKMQIDSGKFIWECYLKRGRPILLTFGLGILINKYLPVAGWGWLVIKACIITTIYIGMIAVFSFQDVKKLISKFRER